METAILATRVMTEAVNMFRDSLEADDPAVVANSRVKPGMGPDTAR
jgi:hypothetical protein